MLAVWKAGIRGKVGDIFLSHKLLVSYFLSPFHTYKVFMHLSLSVVVKDIAIVAGDHGFGSWAGQIRHSDVKCSPPQRCVFGVVLPWSYAAWRDPVTRAAM